MKRFKKNHSRTNATTPYKYEQLENRRVLNGDLGWVILTDNTQFDDQGRTTIQEFTIDLNDDQVADLQTIDQYQYSPDGLTTNYLHQEDVGADGVVDSQYWSEQNFSENGMPLVSLEKWDKDGNGQLDSQLKSSWTVDNDGNPINVVETDVDGDGTFDESRVETIVPWESVDNGWVVTVDDTRLDDQDRITLQDLTFDTNGDGVGDYRAIDEYEYNAEGLLTSYSHREDQGADGVIDSQYSSEQVYTENGQLLVSHDAWDNDGNGQPDNQLRSTWTYDEDGNPINLLTESDVDGDGTYDESREENFDPIVDGDDQVQTLDSYDESGQLIRTSYSYFQNGDEVPDSFEFVSWTYQGANVVNTTTHETDNNADGVVDFRSIGTYEYDVDSVLTAVHYQVDENADGVIDSSYTDIVNSLPLFANPSGNLENVRNNLTTSDLPTTDLPITDLPTTKLTTEKSTHEASLNDVLIAGSGNVSPSFLSTKASGKDTAKRSEPIVGDRLQLAGSVAFDAKRSNNADRDDAFAAIVRESDEILNGDATSKELGRFDGNIEQPLSVLKDSNV